MDVSKLLYEIDQISKSLFQYLSYCLKTQETKFHQKIRMFRVVGFIWVNTIKSDLNLRGFTLNCLEDLFSIRDVASDKKMWNSLFVVE